MNEETKKLLDEFNEWRKTFPDMTPQEVSLILANAQNAWKANARLSAQIEAYKKNYRRMNRFMECFITRVPYTDDPYDEDPEK